MISKALFKFNSGMGALLCSGCNVIIKTGVNMSEQERAAMCGEAHLDPQYCKDCEGSPHYVYALRRVDDGLTRFGNNVAFIEWQDDRRFLKLHDKAAVGRSVILDPNYGEAFTWMTTTITEILEDSVYELKFKTQNSTYHLVWQVN